MFATTELGQPVTGGGVDDHGDRRQSSRWQCPDSDRTVGRSTQRLDEAITDLLVQ